MAEHRAANPSYWWWVLAVVLAIVGGLIAWRYNKREHPYAAKAMLLVGALVTAGGLLQAFAEVFLAALALTATGG